MSGSMVIQIPQLPELPTEIWSDEPPLESDLHREQIELLLACLRLWWKDRSDYYASGYLTIYFNPDHIKSRDFRGPDFFVVLGATPQFRKSWVVWAEQGKYPNLIVEILSGSTADVDRNFKKKLYQDTFRTPEYFWFDPETLELQGFCLMRGQYEPIAPSEEGWLWIQQLDLFLGVQNNQLRYFSSKGKCLPDPKELAMQEARRAEAEQQRAEEAHGRAEKAQQQAEIEQQRAERLAAKLRELGVDPDYV